MASLRMKLTNSFLRATIKPFLKVIPVEPDLYIYPQWIAKQLARFQPNASHCGFNEFYIDDIPCEFVQYRYNNDSNAKTRIVLYLHGGAYIFAGPGTHRQITSHIAKAINGRVLAIDYRKAPEHRHPAPQQDALKAYKWLLAQGYAPENIAFAGDSAGGNLCVTTSYLIRDEGLPMPACHCLMSPWMNLTGESASNKFNEDADPYLPASRMSDAVRMYTDKDVRNPLISPLFGDTTGLPPTLIHVSNNEIVLSDSVDWHRKLKQEGVYSELEVYEGCCHVWQFFTFTRVPESMKSLNDISRFMLDHFRD